MPHQTSVRSTKRLRMENFLVGGPLIQDVCDIISEYSARLEGTCRIKMGGGNCNVRALAVLPDGMLAFASRDFTVGVWDPANGACMFEFGGGYHCDCVTALAVLPANTLASGSYDRTVRVWDITKRSFVLTLAGHTSAVSALAALPDGKLASGSWDRTVRIWDIASGTSLLTYLTRREFTVRQYNQSPHLVRVTRKRAPSSHTRTVWS